MNILRYYKLFDDVKSPEKQTEESACFDIHAHFLTPYAGQGVQTVTVYTMENKKEERTVKMWAGEKSTFQKGIDVYPGERALIPTGLVFDIPDGHSVRLHTRSSISLKKGLIMPNSEGIIDSDYYHQTYVMLYNASADEVRVCHDDRIAQGELVETLNFEMYPTETEPQQKTNRVGGFGSTGV